MNLQSSGLRQSLGTLLKASYLPVKEAQSLLEKKKKYKLDPELSNDETKVFVNNFNKPLILHRGTQNMKDVGEDILLSLGLSRFGTRQKQSQEITRKAEEKYGRKANAVGHSLGGFSAENSGARGKVITFNKPAGLGDILKTTGKKQLDVYTKGDIISSLTPFQKGNKEIIENISSYKNPLTAHNVDNLFY